MDTIKILSIFLRFIQNFQGRQRISSACVETQTNYGPFELVTREGKTKTRNSEMLIR